MVLTIVENSLMRFSHFCYTLSAETTISKRYLSINRTKYLIFKYLLVTFFSSVNFSGVYNKRGKQCITFRLCNRLTLKTLSSFRIFLHFRKGGFFFTYFNMHSYFA